MSNSRLTASHQSLLYSRCDRRRNQKRVRRIQETHKRRRRLGSLALKFIPAAMTQNCYAGDVSRGTVLFPVLESLNSGCVAITAKIGTIGAVRDQI